MDSETIYHYVYRITNIVENKHYYGVRSSKVHPIYDLGIKYFSSSLDKDFIKDQQDNPDNYKYKIIKIYDNRESAISLEIRLHNIFDVGLNENFYNRSKQTSIGWCTFGVTGRKWIKSPNGDFKHVLEKELDYYIDNGWIFCTPNNGKEGNCKNRRWMKDLNGDYKLVKNNLVDEKIKLGWLFENPNKGNKGPNLDKVWLSDENNNLKIVYKNEVKSLLNKGWKHDHPRKGTISPTKNRVEMKTPEGKYKRVKQNEVNDKILLGWIIEGSRTNSKQPKDKCKHCGFIASKTNIKRWHNDNCKKKGS